MNAELLNQLVVESGGEVQMIGDLEHGAISSNGLAVRDCLTGDGTCQDTVLRVSTPRLTFPRILLLTSIGVHASFRTGHSGMRR
jgi:hypothetical protein